MRRNRVQLKPATAPPTILRPQAALNPATVATTAYPSPAPNPLKQAEVHPQGEQQTPEQSSTTAEVTQEPTLKDSEPKAVSSSPVDPDKIGENNQIPRKIARLCHRLGILKTAMNTVELLLKIC